MFENIIGYSQLIDHLKNLVLHRAIPSTMLLIGGPKSGKQTLAIELARILLCDSNKDWNCDCYQCQQSRVLSHQDILFLGNAQLMPEILCGQHMLNTYKTNRDAMFFKRAVFKLLRRADALIWDSSPAWQRGIRAAATSLQELIQEYLYYQADWFDTKLVRALVRACEKLDAAFPANMLPVQCIRNIIPWTHIKSSSRAKIVVISQAETLLSASANLLLKTIEEPQDNVYFILLCHNALAILPTIRSRSQEFILRPRNSLQEIEVLKTVFKVSTDPADPSRPATSGTVGVGADPEENAIYPRQGLVSSHHNSHQGQDSLSPSQNRSSQNAASQKYQGQGHQISQSQRVASILDRAPLTVKSYLESFSPSKSLNSDATRASSSQGETDGSNEINDLAKEYFSSILYLRPFQTEYIQFPNSGNMQEEAKKFISCLETMIKSLLFDDSLRAYAIKLMWRELQVAHTNIVHRNMSASIILEVLYYSLKDYYVLFTQ